MKVPPILHLFFLFPLLFFLVSVAPARETIVVDGQQIRNCSVVEISAQGPVYRCEDTQETYIIPWSKLTPVQVASIRTNHNEALVNAICDGRYVKGTVYDANKEGTIIQISLGETKLGIEGYKKGGKVVTHGLVLINDLPIDIPRGIGDPIEIMAYFKADGKYDMVFGKVDMEYVTAAKPEWFQVTTWTNSAGDTMEAKLIGVKKEDDKVLFEKKDKERVLYNLSELDAASQEKAKKIHERLAKFPVP